LEKIAEKIKKEFFIEIETPYVLIMKVNGKSVSLFKSGKMIVKETTEEKEGRKIAQKVLGFVG
jgi:ribonuclease HIII